MGVLGSGVGGTVVGLDAVGWDLRRSIFSFSRMDHTCDVLDHSRGRVPASGRLPCSIVLTRASRTAGGPEAAILKRRIEVQPA